jgi:hypothetical protein
MQATNKKMNAMSHLGVAFVEKARVISEGFL